MVWNWQHTYWPQFSYDAKQLEPLEREYARFVGVVTGTMKHLESHDKDTIVVHLLSTEGLKTSEIEGEILDRDSVQSSIRRKLGLSTTRRQIEPAEAGVAEMMIDMYTRYDDKLTHTELHRWNTNLLQGRTDLERKGAYRTHDEPMQIVSGGLGKETIHFEAPPSKNVPAEMSKFIEWFNNSRSILPPLARAGIAHLYSVSIHPYEDGNGRMSRALAEKVLSQSAGSPALSSLSRQIAMKKSAYYDALERNNKNLEITDWLVYFAETVIAAKQYSISSVERIIQKAEVFNTYGEELNERQKKVVNKLFEAEPEGFKGGLSAQKYIAITGAPRATVTRDLQKLVALGILHKTGTRRFARYWLPD